MFKIFGSRSKDDGGEKSATIKEIEQFLHVHEAPESPVGTSLGSKGGFTTLGKSGETQKLYVTEKLFAHAFTDVLHLNKCPDTVRAITKHPKEPKKKIAITAKTANDKDRVTMVSQKTGDLFCVVQQNIHLTRQTYHIYGGEPMPKPGDKNQKHAHHPAPVDKVHHHGKALFPYAKAEVKSSGTIHLSLDVYDPADHAYHPDVYTVERISSSSGGWLASKPFLVKRLGIPAALLKKGDFPDGITCPAWNCTIGPGIDPILITGLIAIMDTQNL
mmetsp:Transcript_7822/g.11243  ORF Transcript_7822/g.11243 Transcript_7822/m.11243 type:complete len:273 (+) Transcript_7822:332-1150(+)